MTENPLVKTGKTLLLALAGAVVLAVIVTAQAAPDFAKSFITGPLYAHPGDVISYTVVAVNTGGPAQEVTLSATLPSGTLFVPGSCRYVDEAGTWPCSSAIPGPLWHENVAAGGHITTTFAATVTAGTLRLPLVAHVRLTWGEENREMAFTTTVRAAFPDLTASYKTGPSQAESGDLLTYTIVAVNNGDPASGITLSDPVPTGTAFISCRYSTDTGDTLSCDSDEPPVLWTLPLSSAGRITTEVVLRLEAGTIRWPLRNCARLSWENLQQEMCSITLANPTARVYLPLVLRNYAPFYNGDFSKGLKYWETGGVMQVAPVGELYNGERVAGAVILGGDDDTYADGEVPMGYGALWRTIYVPDVPNAALTIRYRVVTHDAVFGQQTNRFFDDLEVAIDRKPWEADKSERLAAGCNTAEPVPNSLDVTSGGLIFCDGNRSGSPTGADTLYDTDWHTVILNLGEELRGRSIVLYLANFNRIDHFWNTWSYIDEINISW